MLKLQFNVQVFVCNYNFLKIMAINAVKQYNNNINKATNLMVNIAKLSRGKGLVPVIHKLS